MDFTTRADPITLFNEWLGEAMEKEPDVAEAMTLATVDGAGIPSARLVLLKDADEAGFVFYTNLESRKGVEMEQNPNVALVFHWKSLRRQVRVVGTVTLVSDAEADAYFATRPRGAQVGAWASDQSRPMETMFDLEKRIARHAARFGLAKVPRPPHWSGYRVKPREIEFWQDKPFRLHERAHFVQGPDGWLAQRLFP